MPPRRSLLPRAIRLCAAALLLSAAAHAQPGTARVTTADAVRLRAGPSTDAAVVRTLGIAAPLAVEGSAAGPWLRVRTSDGARGWVTRDLTAPYDSADPLGALRPIAERSIARERAPLQARVRLVNALSDALRTARGNAARAELSLLRLRALQKALDEHAAGASAPSGWESRPLREAGIRADTGEIAYGEPQGQWYVRADAFWALHDRYRALPIAERIAWSAATQDLPGECEADPTCIFSFVEITVGRYLSLHPRGAHAAAALRNMAEPLAFVETETRATHAQFCTASGAEYTVKRERITALARVVAASAGAERARVAELLRKLAERCA